MPPPMASARSYFTATVAAALLSALATSAVQAQVFSPGPLSKDHSALEGVTNCKRCHGDESQHDDGRCLSCHLEIQKRVGAGQGYHAKVKAQACAQCHREHRGASAQLIEWPGGQKAFNHALTQWPLVGKHKRNACQDCHEPRRVTDAKIRDLMAKGRAPSFLGLPTACASCHFDEHRSERHGGRQLPCSSCHTPERFKPAAGFNHNAKAMTSYPLTGLHRRVDCVQCHGAVVDDETSTTAFPAPSSRTYLQFADIPHNSCVECHDDAHRGAFGPKCTNCHSTAGWKQIIQSAEDFGFHDKTRFPLRGQHTVVACRTCHGPFRGQKAVFRGLPHSQCADCHQDAHVGQLAPGEAGVVACDRCHSVNGFVPVLFDDVAHQKTKFPLDGSHRAIACNACHTSDDKLARRVSRSVRAQLERQKRPIVVSSALLALPALKRVGGDTGDVRCEGCHDDPHAGQFSGTIAKQGCNGCHQTSAFQDERFNHASSRFPLEGKHQKARCGQCHPQEKPKRRGQAPVTRYAPLSLACAACHRDEHVGQLARSGTTDCARCHQSTGFRPSTFQHDDPKQTRFVLEGKHKDVLCAKCHVAVSVAGVDNDGATTSRYRPLPMDCASCHVDEHEGRFDRFAP